MVNACPNRRGGVNDEWGREYKLIKEKKLL